MNSKKIIIDNRAGISDINALIVIYKVVGKGRISKDTKDIKHYCWAVRMSTEEYGDIVVHTRKKKNENSPDSFIIDKE
jgi:hypothetical protein